MTKIIGIAGRKFSGKDTVAKLFGDLGYENVKMAGALKGMLRFYLGYIGANQEVIERMIEGDLKEEPSAVLGGKTPRWAMQSLGTEWGRDLIYQNIWVDSFVLRAELFDKVVCSDVRFPNEVDVIRNLGGKVYRIERDTGPNEFSNHPSEAMIDGLDVDGIIDNNGTLDDLANIVRRLDAE